MDGFDLPRIKADYDTLGFAIVPGFLVGPELRQAQQQAERYFMEIAPTKPDSEAFYLDRNDPSSIVQAHEMFELPYFRELPWNHNFLALAKLCGGTQEIAPMNVKHTQDGKRYAGSMELHNKGPGGRCVPSPPHQDNWYFNKIGGEVPTVWVALEDIDELNGCLRLAPCSPLAAVPLAESH
jgi:phytanoyl-CoA hydroxylase